MAYSCKDCDFTAQFESALTMHRQLHHDIPVDDPLKDSLQKILKDKANTIPRVRELSPSSSVSRKNRGIRLVERASATRLFSKIRSRICRSRTVLSTYNEEPGLNETQSECTSKAINMEQVFSPIKETNQEVYSCHLCEFDADRITALDRHLLNHHKLSLDSLLQLVLSKTKDGLNEDQPKVLGGSRQPYYRPVNTVIESGEYFIEAVAPKIKILKHAAVNTDLMWQDIPDLKDNCTTIRKEIDKLVNFTKGPDKSELLEKMATLNECMCKFVDSSNTLKKVLSKDDGKWRRGENQPFHLKLESSTPREWERACSDKMERKRVKSSSRNRSEQAYKLTSGSFYF